MTDDDGTHPLEVEQIECAPLGRGKVAVRVTGRWRGRQRVSETSAFLVVEADGRRHRFPAMPEPRRARFVRPASWGASFALPAWLEPRLGEQMTLWLGNDEIPLPAVSFVSAPTPEAEGEPGAAAEPAAPPARRDPGNGDDETVAALRAELAQRAATEAQLRGALAGTKAQLDARAVHQTELESTQAELRSELEQLLALVEQESSSRAEVESRAVVLAAEVAELQDRVSELTASRDQVAEETSSLRQELDRAAGEALALRDELVGLRGIAEQDGAERVLLEARTDELSEQLSSVRAELAHSEVAGEAATSEAVALRAELDRLGAELAHSRGSNSSGDGLREAQSLLVEARALTARLRERSEQAESR
jgi:hypothetical protein